ncbi:hypothetical protein cypCar_00037868 [Cyprinus carpio]|nr:hypothetical protein cypCar_00037868 [Cyprinus carpio]
MAGVKIKLLAFVFILASSAASNKCPANQETFCDSLRSSLGYTYMVPADIPCFEKCEQGWYYQNGTFIVDSTPNAGGKRLPTVVDVTPRKLLLSVCENLQWQLVCDKCNCIINYLVTDLKHLAARDTLTRNNTSGDEQDGNREGNADLPDWVIALIVIVVVGASIAILIIGIRTKGFCKPKQNAVL